MKDRLLKLWNLPLAWSIFLVMVVAILVFMLMMGFFLGCSKYESPTAPPTTPLTVASISGVVMAGGRTLPGVTVNLSGTTSRAMATNLQGQFAFENLPQGEFAVSITNPDTTAYVFPIILQTVKISVSGILPVNFYGSLKSTPLPPTVYYGSVQIGVVVDGAATSGITVSIVGVGQVKTILGQAVFNNVPVGTYKVTVSGFGSDVVFDRNEESVTVAVSQTATALFSGKTKASPPAPLSSISGGVTAGGKGISVKVLLTGAAAREMLTNSSGEFSFRELAVGNYIVSIANFDTAYVFQAVSQSVKIEAAGAAVQLNFTGTVKPGVQPPTQPPTTPPTPSVISGNVTVNGAGLANVPVALRGAVNRDTVAVGTFGSFAFVGLQPGNYIVSIRPDTSKYVFPMLSQTIGIPVGTSGTFRADFSGSAKPLPPPVVIPSPVLATIIGNFFIDENSDGVFTAGLDKPVPGATVSFSGVRTGSVTTSADGRYAVENLAAGAYVVSVVNPDAAKFRLDREHNNTSSVDVLITSASGTVVVVNFPLRRK